MTGASLGPGREPSGQSRQHCSLGVTGRARGGCLVPAQRPGRRAQKRTILPRCVSDLAGTTSTADYWMVLSSSGERLLLVNG